MKPALIIIAQEGFQDVEFNGTKKGLEDAGFSIVIASTEVGECTGKFGGKEHATVALRDVVVTEYDRVAFIGGPGAHALVDNFDALNVARTTVDAEIPLGAICIAPKILANAGLLKGKKATVFDTDGENEQFLIRHGAEYTGEPVTVDGHVVTANGPEVAEEFGKVFAGLNNKQLRS